MPGFLLSLCTGAFLASAHGQLIAAAPLADKYATLQNQTCARVAPHIPVLPTADAAAFMTAYQAFKGKDDTAVVTAAEKLLTRPDVTQFLGLPDSFQAGGLDADMVLCAVLTDATPAALSAFAAKGKDQESIVDSLLKDTMLMRDMLVAGGATDGLYGEAASIHQQILKASSVLTARDSAGNGTGTPWDDRTQDKKAILQRLALGTAVELAMPVPLQFKTTNPSPWGPQHAGGDGNGNVDPVVRYLNLEKAYLAGNLDPRFEVLTAFEYRHVAADPASEEDTEWMRTTLANYRPDYVASGGDKRYDQSVHTEIAEGHNPVPCPSDICTNRYAQLPVTGGVCGIRAFYTRHTRRAFGMPVWGVTERGHAALSTWNPDGWRVVLGANWEFGFWAKRGRSQGGSNFYLDTQARELRSTYQTVLRANWAAFARGDAPINPSWSPAGGGGYGEGGLWSALTLYIKLTATKGKTIPVRPVGPPVLPNKVADLAARWVNKTTVLPNITVDAAGTITVPAASYSWKNKSASVQIMKSFEGGVQLFSRNGDYVDPSASAFAYEVPVAKAGTYYLTANHSTWHTNQDLLVSVTANTTAGAGAGAASVNVPVYYTVGYWNETQAIPVKLVEGTNVLTFSRHGSRGVSFKNFNLYVKNPTIAAPPANYTVISRPPASAYKEEPPSTSCKLQGITSVDNIHCEDACKSIGGKYTGARGGYTDVPNSGCYTLVSGPYKGNCNYFSVVNSTCTTPPCGDFAELCLTV